MKRLLLTLCSLLLFCSAGRADSPLTSTECYRACPDIPSVKADTDRPTDRPILSRRPRMKKQRGVRKDLRSVRKGLRGVRKGLRGVRKNLRGVKKGLRGARKN